MAGITPGAMQRLEALLEPDDPDELFELIDEIAVGSFGAVYKVHPLSPLLLYVAKWKRLKNKTKQNKKQPTVYNVAYLVVNTTYLGKAHKERKGDGCKDMWYRRRRCHLGYGRGDLCFEEMQTSKHRRFLWSLEEER